MALLAILCVCENVDWICSFFVDGSLLKCSASFDSCGIQTKSLPASFFVDTWCSGHQLNQVRNKLRSIRSKICQERNIIQNEKPHYTKQNYTIFQHTTPNSSFAVIDKEKRIGNHYSYATDFLQVPLFCTHRSLLRSVLGEIVFCDTSVTRSLTTRYWFCIK